MCFHIHTVPYVKGPKPNTTGFSRWRESYGALGKRIESKNRRRDRDMGKLRFSTWHVNYMFIKQLSLMCKRKSCITGKKGCSVTK